MIGRRGLLGGAVAWWASGNARSPQGPQTREAQRLDRRVLGTQRAGVGPAPSQDVIRATLVLITGAGAGVFLYSAAPAHGDLVESVSEATSDPFTNPVRPGFASYDNVFGNSAQLHGAVLSLFTAAALAVQLGPAGESIFNASGALIYNVNVGKDAWFLYADTGSAVQGRLIASSASAGGTDQFGNTFKAGVNAYVTVTGIFAGTYAISLNDQTQAWGANVAAMFFQNLTNPPTIGPAVTGQAHSTAGCNINLQSGKSTGGAVGATVQVQDSVSSSVTGGLVDVIAGKLEVLATDGNVYRTERLSLIAKNVAQGINSTTPATIAGLSCFLGVGTYRFRARLVCTQGLTAQSQNFRFTGSGGLVTSDGRLTATSLGAASTVIGVSTVTALAADLASGAFAAGVTWVTNIDGWYQVSTAGTVALQASEGGAGNAYTVVDGTLDVEPT